MLKFFLVFILLFTLSCTNNKTIKINQKTENISIIENLESKNKDFFIFYEDLSKESLLINIISQKVNKLGFSIFAIPISKMSEYKKYHKSSNYNVLFFLGNSIYKSKSILNKEYNYLIIDSPSIDGNISKNLSLSSTVILADFSSIKYAYKIMNNRNFKLDLRYDKYAWLLNKDTDIEGLISINSKLGSKLNFKKKNNLIHFDTPLSNQLLIFFTKNKVVLEKCSRVCSFKEIDKLNSVYIPINKSYVISKKYIRESIIIKKIFNLIAQKEYLDSYLLLLENKNTINSYFFKKTFDFLREALYNLESDLIRRYDGEYKQGNANR